MIYRMTPKAQATKTKSRQMGLHQTKKLFSVKDTINREKKHLQNEKKKIFANHICNKVLVPRIYKEFL